MTHSPNTGTEVLVTAGTESSQIQLEDDMHDNDAVQDLPTAASPLREALLIIEEALLSRYDEHDQLATSSQRRYRFVIFVIAWGGALAILGGAAQLMFVALDMHTAAHLAEKFGALLIVLTAIGVLAGIRLAQLENWLLDRFKAEQLRLLKYRMLLDPRIWGSSAHREAWKSDLIEQRDSIIKVTQRTLAQESERDQLPVLPIGEQCAAISPEQLDSFLVYWRRTRIETQLRHFTAAASRTTSFLDQPRMLPWFFFVSILLVGGHVFIEQALQRVPNLFGDGTRLWEQVSIVLVGLSVALPVVWLGIRAWRSARESVRNVTRSAARRHMLAGVLPMLDQMKANGAAYTFSQLLTLELVLESDKRGWLRLMREVEWYS